MIILSLSSTWGYFSSLLHYIQFQTFYMNQPSLEKIKISTKVFFNLKRKPEHWQVSHSFPIKICQELSSQFRGEARPGWLFLMSFRSQLTTNESTEIFFYKYFILLAKPANPVIYLILHQISYLLPIGLDISNSPALAFWYNYRLQMYASSAFLLCIFQVSDTPDRDTFPH